MICSSNLCPTSRVSDEDQGFRDWHRHPPHIIDSSVLNTGKCGAALLDAGLAAEVGLAGHETDT